MKKAIKLKPSEYEGKWKDVWEKKRIYQPDLLRSKKPFYNLMMFPYPSAEGLHVGNMYAFTGADIYGRFMRMKGYDVFEPIGLDGFGIHSENYAIKLGKHPKEQAKVSEKNFYRQLSAIGNGFAWENRLETYDPDYYRWTQWIFVEMFKHGLAYRKKSPVNFCPSCKTVLSDEQVINKIRANPSANPCKSDQKITQETYNGCERCGTEVEKRAMEQWFFRITRYAEKLLQNTYKKDFHWSDKVKVGQQNWIGRSEGVQIEFRIQNSEFKIEVFTTAIDTIYGTTFMILSPDNPLLTHKEFSENFSDEVKKYIADCKKSTSNKRSDADKEKTGVFTGYYAVNPFTNKNVPIWIADYVLMDYGTGAIMGVPGHDGRDYDFAKKYNIPIIPVIKPDSEIADIVKIFKDGFWDYEEIKTKYEDHAILFNSDNLDNLTSSEAKKRIQKRAEEMKIGRRVTTYRLRDWCISRQRYWGAPIPMVFCPSCAEKGESWFTMKSQAPSTKHQINSKFENPNSKNIQYSIFNIQHSTEESAGWYPVPEDQLPVLLPDLADWKPEGTGKGPLAKLESFVNVVCPKCGSPARRETDVCDTFLDSSWYFLRYPSEKSQIPNPKSSSFAKASADRQINSKIQNLNSKQDYAPTTNNQQQTTHLPWNPQITRRWLPVDMYIGGAEHTVLHLLYSRFVTMALKDFGHLDFEEPYRRFYAHGLIIAEGAKMSKSRGNVIIPDEYIAKYGADTLRTYLMFLGPFDMGGDFRDTGIAGMYKFLSRVWRMTEEFITQNSKFKVQNQTSKVKTETTYENTKLTKVMHKTIKEVTEDLENLRYNTAIAHIMEYVNELQNYESGIMNKEYIETLLLLLAPFAPFMTEELWMRIKNYESRIKNANNQQPIYPSKLQRSGATDFQSIHHHPWPSFDPNYLVEDEVTVAVQVNGKLRDTLVVGKLDIGSKKLVEDKAKETEKVKKHLEGKTILKVIFVPGRILNFVVS